METVVEEKRKTGFVFTNNSIIVEKQQHTDLDQFFKGTISGEELVNYVCDRLDEKYNGKNRTGSI